MDEAEHHDNAATLWTASVKGSDPGAEFFWRYAPRWIYMPLYKLTGWGVKRIVIPVYIMGEHTGMRVRYRWVRTKLA